jgi:hypothetical protein
MKVFIRRIAVRLLTAMMQQELSARPLLFCRRNSLEEQCSSPVNWRICPNSRAEPNSVASAVELGARSGLHGVAFAD